jgi:predicted RNA-binding protein with TRAM domain
MVKIPDDLRTLFSSRLERQNDQYVFEVPAAEVENETVDVGDSYRIAVVPTDTPARELDAESGQARESPSDRDGSDDDPPVDEGEQLRVEIDELGDEGDGVATIGGFVIFVDGAMPGDRPLVEIDSVSDTMAFATVVDNSAQTARS